MSTGRDTPPHRPPGGMDEDDYRLSMAISPRAAREQDNAGLRAVLVHRLHDSIKAVRRWSLNGNGSSTYCEHCRRWVRHRAADTHAAMIPAEWRCPQCQKLWGIELMIYGELVEDEPEEGREGEPA